ncbi:MAG TPA: hypothetical protein VFQ53_22180 [Kofleriaceae bacterium]|nr:hypothetical protein [Kofleriaceae bacterium]
MRACLVICAALVGASARAEAEPTSGLYFSQSLGIGRARGDLAPMVGNAMRTRASIGARVRWLAIEPWITSDLQTARDGALQGIVGGEPAAGRSDLSYYGVDVKLIAPLVRADNAVIESYVRGGGSIVEANGALDGYGGHALGVGAGVQLTGRVRALGFLWAPLFLIKKGPKVSGSLFLDQGFEFVTLRSMSTTTPLTSRVGHVTLGFAVGTRF